MEVAMTARIELEWVAGGPAGARPFEIVERKGTGHPDFICDVIADEAAAALAQVYMDEFGKVLHFDLGKGLLAAGRATPKLGGGTVEEPMRLVFGDRAVYEFRGKRVPVPEIIETAAAGWIRKHLRFVEPGVNVVFQNQVRPGSAEPTASLDAREPLANDTATGVGFAPLSETEALVLEAERFLNSRAFKEEFPESGEDVKVMGARRGRFLDLTVAMALVDRHLTSEREYFSRKVEIEVELAAHLRARLEALDGLTVGLNMLDRPASGTSGMYLTVTGTSAESGDSGQVGRGNRLSGLVSTTRPVSNEAAAGKNPVRHVGNVYNMVARRVASEVAALAGVREATVYLVGRIGSPLKEPHLAAAQLSLSPGAALEEIRVPIEEVFHRNLAAAGEQFREPGAARSQGLEL
jgi:S-adenosylmethionine synthetase